MTENKPIIDGVDVSECIFYQANFEEDFDVKIKHFCSNWHNSCESVNNSNCYFKQLTRKTQECEYWKHQAELGSDTTDRLAKQLEEKEQECEELKRDNSTLFNKVMETRKENEKLKNEIEACYNQVEDFDIIATSKSNKLKQAEQKLGQIRVIAFHTCDKTDKNDPCYKILQIIDEVE